MGFKDEKQLLLECLTSGNILHEPRDGIDIKNLLATGQISVEQVSQLVGRARGSNYECSEHHTIRKLDVHIIKIQQGGLHWYIKWYYIEPNCVFISVHN